MRHRHDHRRIELMRDIIARTGIATLRQLQAANEAKYPRPISARAIAGEAADLAEAAVGEMVRRGWLSPETPAQSASSDGDGGW